MKELRQHLQGVTVALKRFDAYVKGLSGGLNAYPHVTQKAHGLRIGLATAGLERKLDLLPPELCAWVTEPPPAGAWVSEVKVQALLLATGDVCFGPDDGAFDAYVYDVNRKLLGGPVFAILFKLLGPNRISQGAAGRWDQLHRNTTLSTKSAVDHGCTLLLDAPANHVPASVARTYALALRVAFELSGARAVKFDAQVESPSRVQFTGSWS